MPEPAKTGLGRKALKTAGIALLSLAGFFLVALAVLYLLAEPIVERSLQKQVTVQTHGLYQVKFDDLQLHLRTRSVTLQGLHLYPDSLVHRRQREQGQGSQTLLDVRSPRLTITRIDLLGLLFKNRLSINTIVAKRPVITQLLDESVKRGRKAAVRGSGSLKAVSIRLLRIQDARYRYMILGQRQRPQHEISQLSLLVRDLRLDMQEKRGLSEMLRAGQVELHIRDYTFHTPDSVYTISVRRLYYSSKKQTLKAEEIAVQPDYQVNAIAPEDRVQRLLYQFRIPLLYLAGVEAGTAWRTKRLQLKKLLVAQPNLVMVEDLSVSGPSHFPELAALYARISPYLQEITAEEVRLRAGSFTYRQKNSELLTIHHLERATVNLQALQLDSISLFAPEAKAFAAGVRVGISHYTYTPQASPYRFQVSSLQLSSQDKSLQVEGLHLTGDRDKNDSLKASGKALHTFYDLALPRLRFQGLDLLQALRISRLSIGNVTAEKPVIEVRTDQQVARGGKGEHLWETGRQLSGLINRLEIGKIDLVDASLITHSKTGGHIQRLQELEHADLAATGLHVDLPYTFHPDQKLPLEEILVTAQNYRFQLPDKTYAYGLTDLRYATRLKEFTARTVAVVSSNSANDQQKRYKNASRNLFDLSANGLRITGVDLLKALQTRRLEADLVVLRQPDVTIQVDRKVTAIESGRRWGSKGLFELVDVIAAKNIRLEDGSFAFNERLDPVLRTHWLEHVDASVSGFLLTPASFAHLDEALPMREMDLLAKNYTYHSTDSLYTIRLDSLYYSSSTKQVIAHTFTVRADRDVNEHLKAVSPDRASRNLINISAQRSRITGFNLIHAYATGQYRMDSLLLTGPKVKVLQDHNVTPASVKSEAPSDTTAANPLMELPAAFRVGRVQVTDGTLDFNILEDTIRVSQTLEHVTMAIDQFRLISLEETEVLDIFDADDLELLVQGYSYYTADSLYVMEVKDIKASMKNRALLIDSLRVRPLYSKQAYAALFTYARDRIDLAVPEVAMQGISLRALFDRQDLIAHKVLVQNPYLEIYRDNRLGINPALRPPTLQSALRKASVYIRLDTILVEKQSLVEHPVVAKDALQPGVLVLEDIQMELYNVTNDSTLIRRNNMLTVNASAQLMGVSALQVHCQFQMDHPQDRYTCEGMLEPMDFSALNPLVENMLFIRAQSGRINQASFSIEATDQLATGKVKFPYNNLKIQLLNKQNPEHAGFLLKAKSLLVNTFIIKSSNPSSLGKFREGMVREARDPRRSVSYHLSQSVSSGVTRSLMTKMVYRIVSRFIDL